MTVRIQRYITAVKSLNFLHLQFRQTNVASSVSLDKRCFFTSDGEVRTGVQVTFKKKTESKLQLTTPTKGKKF